MHNIKTDLKLLEALARSKEQVDTMTPEERAEMFRIQGESFVRAEISWPKSKYKWVNGVKIYDSYEDYIND